MKILITLFAAVAFMSQTPNAIALEELTMSELAELKNYQVNSPAMVSSGLPTQAHFDALKTMGVTKVIDLIPGDRTAESNLMTTMNLEYHNIQVEWEKPTLENFADYVTSMQQSAGSDGITLTHCKLNWRGAVFTYLYRVTQLNESEVVAKRDMIAIWQPNEIWQAFINEVKAEY